MDLRDDSYELFRRAVVEQDADAWALITARYRNLMIAWVMRCQASNAVSECKEDLADHALARAWAALSPERFTNFPNLAALMAYLRTCVVTTVIDAVRVQVVHDRAIHSTEWDSIVTPEQAALDTLGRAELWQLVNELVSVEAERVALVERFVLDLPPRVIKARHPTLFPDVSVVYSSIRNLCNRLRRNRDIQRLYAERRAA